VTDTYDVTNPDKPTIVKDPNAVLDYTFDWTAWLDDVADSIATRQIIPATGITVDSSAIVGKKVIAWLSGGTAGQKYQVTCRITTAGGRTDDRSIFIKVKER
jgi:hypothetical protein